MRFDFKEVPGSLDERPRPLVPVVVEGSVRSPYFCLADTGSLENRFGAWVARWHGIDLTGAPEDTIGIGGFRSVGRTVPVRLSIGDFSWEAPVSFCDPWPLDFQLLGQQGFFRWFDVRIRAAQFTIDLEPEDR